jgi:membrane protein involved in D-alanine export
MAFLFFFPTISSGPIDRYRRFGNDWNRHPARAEIWKDLDAAVHQVFTGFLYKFILAALIKTYWIDPLGGGLRDTVLYMYGYSLYLFFDFAGYSAFAVGVSYLLGIHTPENFDRPFLARNIREFWNRWHISLSTLLRDHVYMRFVLAATKGRWFKGKYTASYLAFFLAFGLMGLWHGTEPYYLLYGLYHGALLVGFDIFSRWNKRSQVWREGPLWRAAGVLVTFHLVCLGFLLFSGRIGPAWKPAAAPPVRQAAAPNQQGAHPVRLIRLDSAPWRTYHQARA